MSTARERLLVKKGKKILQKAAMDASAGDWESLKYMFLDAQKMRKFLELINETGNSLPCEQKSVTFVEMTLKLNKTFKGWCNDPNVDQVKRDGWRKGFAYLFTVVP